MDRNEIIEEILRLVPSSAERRERSRPLLQRLPDDALHQTHRDLSTLAQQATALMSKMDLATLSSLTDRNDARLEQARAARAGLDAVAARIKARQAEMAHAADLQVLAARAGRWQAITPAVRDIARSVVGPAAASPSQMATMPQHGLGEAPVINPDLKRPAVPSLEVIRRKITRLLRHPFVWSDTPALGREQTIEALARVENHVASDSPDVVVAINDEGRAISSLIAHDLNLRAPIAVVDGSADTELLWRSESSILRRDCSICIIGHVAWSGETIRAVVDLTQRRFHARRISVAVLATSVRAAERMEGVADFTFHHVTVGPRIRLGIDPAKLRVQGNDYIFGSTFNPKTDIMITGKRLGEMRTILGQRFRDIPSEVE